MFAFPSRLRYYTVSDYHLLVYTVHIPELADRILGREEYGQTRRVAGTVLRGDGVAGAACLVMGRVDCV